MYNFLANTKRMTISSMVIALYVVLLYVTHGRFLWSLFKSESPQPCMHWLSCSPFLVVPMGIANFAANFLFGGLGLLDMAGGCLVGWLTTWLIVQVRLRGWNVWLAALPIWWVPSLGVSLWLSYLIWPSLRHARRVVVGRAVSAGSLRRISHPRLDQGISCQ